MALNKQTNKRVILIPRAVKAVTLSKAPLSLQPTTQEWAGCIHWPQAHKEPEIEFPLPANVKRETLQS